MSPGTNSETGADDNEAAATAEADAADTDQSTDTEVADESIPAGRPKLPTQQGRSVSVSLRALVLSAVIVGLTAGLAVMTWLYIGANGKLSDEDRQAADSNRAETIALDYAVNAAIMDYKDLGPWRENLVKGTTPDLGKKLSEAATAMEQILLPLQWSSTAKPLAAKVRSRDNGLYVVDAFVGVMTKTVQAAENLQSTATYSITLNSNDNWLISDVGGIAAVVNDK